MGRRRRRDGEKGVEVGGKGKGNRRERWTDGKKWEKGIKRGERRIKRRKRKRKGKHGRKVVCEGHRRRETETETQRKRYMKTGKEGRRREGEGGHPTGGGQSPTAGSQNETIINQKNQ